MKQILLTFLFAASIGIGFSQDNGKLMLFTSQKKFEEAKKEVDKLSNDPKTKDKPETIYWIMNVYSELYADSALNAKYPNSHKTAYDALNAYVLKDTSFKILKENGLRPIGLLYSGSFNDGKKFFSKQQWEDAFINFKQAEELSEFINKNGFGANKLALDTFTVLLAGYASQNANKPQDAIKYYSMLADKKIGGQDFMNCYTYLVDYYEKNKDNEKFSKYLNYGKELYPSQSSIWSQFEMSNLTENSSLEDILSKFKQDDAGGKLTEEQYIGYAETFAGVNRTPQAKIDSAKQIEVKYAAAECYKKAFSLNNNGIYAFNAGVLFYSIYGVLDERFFNLRGATADLKAKRDAVEKDQYLLADQAIEWLEKAYTILKVKENRERSESSSLNKSIDFLANIYQWKRDKSKGKLPATDYDKYDTKFKLYDVEHDKYK